MNTYNDHYQFFVYSSVDPIVNHDTVINLLYSSLILQFCILLLLFELLLLYMANKFVANEWDLKFIKNTLGEEVYSFVKIGLICINIISNKRLKANLILLFVSNLACLLFIFLIILLMKF